MGLDKSPSKVRLRDFNPAIGFERGAGKAKLICWYLTKMFFFLSSFPFPSSLKAMLLRAFGARIGTGLVLKPRVNIHFPWKLEIGNDVWIGEEACLLNFEKLTICNNVCISQRAFICGGNHDFLDPSMSYRNGPVLLQEGCWIGSAVFVCPGITVGTDAVVSAGAVVSMDLAANGIYKGNPAGFVKHRWDSASLTDVIEPKTTRQKITANY